MRPIDNEDALLEKLREKLGPSKKQDDRAELERLFGKREQTEEDRLRARLVKPTVAVGDVIDITIEKLAFGGEGIGRHSNLPVFIYGVVPGDTVRVTITHVGKDFCRGDVIETTAPSSNRIPARCPLFGSCGGCHIQSLVYTAQLKAKETMAADTLARIGNVDTRVRNVIASPDSFGYRICTRLHVERDAEHYKTGFFARRSKTVIPVSHCPLLTRSLNNILAALPDTLPAPGTAPVPDEIQLQMSVDTGEVVMHCRTSSAVLGVEAILDKCRQLNLPVKGVSADTKNGLVEAGDVFLNHRIGSLTLQTSSNSFIQANHYLYKQLIDQVILLSSPAASDIVLDLYCGSGFFSLPVARFVTAMTGLDSNSTAIQNARLNADRARLSNTIFKTVDDKNFFEDSSLFNAGFSLVLVDPPRTGLSPEALKGIIRLKPAKLMYISCDPSTLARDLRALAEADFRIRVIQPIDMFPHTYHLETLAFLTHRHTGTQAAYQAFADLR